MMPYSMMPQPKSKSYEPDETVAAASSVDATMASVSLGPSLLTSSRLPAYLSTNNNNFNNFNNFSNHFNASTNFNQNSVSLLSPARHEALANYQSGVLSPSTPPVSRQRRHSKMHLRIASVDQQGESGNYSSFLGDLPPPAPQPSAISSFGSPSKNNASTIATSSTGVKSATSSSAPGNACAVLTATKPVKERYRIVILGSSAVGKTAIVEQFLYGSFPETHCCTVEELHKGEYEIAGGQVVPLEILDTSGSFTFTAMRNLAIANGDAFALVYSIDSPESWEEVKAIRELILQLKGSEPSSPPIVVVGNKADLPEERRQVKLEVAECECIDWESGFVECSAKTNKNIVNIFSCMLIQARLKGSLNVDSIIASNSSRHIGYRDPASRAQRRRSSLPISELFHRSSRSERGGDRGSGGGGGLESVNRISDPRTSGTFRKRNSCTPS